MLLTLDTPTLDNLVDFRPVRAPDLNSTARRRIELLDPRDQRLMHLALAGHSIRSLSTLVGITPGTVSRRIRKLTRRLSNPIVAALAEKSEFLSPQYREIGLRYFLHRHSIEQISRSAALSRADVKSILGLIRQWHTRQQ